MKSKHQSEQQEARQPGVSDDTILKVTKEIVVKFIEMGKITPAGFDLAFKNIHSTIDKTVRKKQS